MASCAVKTILRIGMSKESNTDQELIHRIRKGDKSAFRILFDKFYQLLLGVAITLLKDLDAAKDAVQDVFFQIWKKREQIQIQLSVSAYLKRAVRNQALNQIRRNKAFADSAKMTNEVAKEANVLEIMEGNDLQEVLQKTIDSLPERCRLVFMMRRMQGMSHKDIAESLDISTKTIENQMTKALSILKKAVAAYQQNKIT